MITTRRIRSVASIVTITAVLCCTSAVGAQEPAPAPVQVKPSLLSPFTDVLGNIRRLPTQQNLEWLLVGATAALAAHSYDRKVTAEWSATNSPFGKRGARMGGTPLQLGAAFATFAIGRATNHPRAMNLGADLIQAQLLAEVMTTGAKQAIRRHRPQGSGFSFPSGHTAVTFASATVIQRHFGWKAGLPAYAVAGYVGASRIRLKRHYLSDVAFGAAVGLVAGRTVTLKHRLRVEPMLARGGGGAMFTWIERR